MARIGVFICHCGLNIASTVDVERAASALRAAPGVALTAHYPYMCSDPGQNLVRQAIREHGLDGVVIAACSPSMHEVTFRNAAQAVGLNRYRVEIANIREHVSWPHRDDPEAATRKAIETIHTLVEKVRGDEPLSPFTLPITRRALVVGGGIAGLTTALDIADAGYPVVLVERSDRLGGKMADLASLYLDVDDSKSLLQARIDAVTNHPLIEIFLNAEVTAFEGYIGNFAVQVSSPREQGRQHPASASPSSGRESGGWESGGPISAHDVGTVVLTTGFDLYPKANLPEYGAGRYADVIDSLQFEKMLADARCSQAGEIRRPSDGRIPREVVWIQCAGSRAPERHQSHCSKICCMYVAKQASAYRRAVPEGQAYVFYIDIRSQGLGYDEYVQEAIERDRVVYLRGQASKIVRHGGELEVWGADTLAGKPLRVQADLVVLAMAAVPSAGSEDLARLVRVSVDDSGFLSEAHPKLRPVESLTAGIYLAGAAQFPKDVPETVAQASGAAAKVLELFAQPEMVAEPTVAVVDERICVGCGLCVPACPYDARELHPWKTLATVNEALCQGCGACAVACRNKATIVRNLTTEQVLSMMEAVL
jgi:heterodisulfide reductase subunit A